MRCLELALSLAKVGRGSRVGKLCFWTDREDLLLLSASTMLMLRILHSKASRQLDIVASTLFDSRITLLQTRGVSAKCSDSSE